MSANLQALRQAMFDAGGETTSYEYECGGELVSRPAVLIPSIDVAESHQLCKAHSASILSESVTFFTRLLQYPAGRDTPYEVGERYQDAVWLIDGTDVAMQEDIVENFCFDRIVNDRETRAFRPDAYERFDEHGQDPLEEYATDVRRILKLISSYVGYTVKVVSAGTVGIRMRQKLSADALTSIAAEVMRCNRRFGKAEMSEKSLRNHISKSRGFLL